MANITTKFSINVSGPYYVDKNCIGCRLCAEIAPQNIRADEDASLKFSHNYVFSQPASKAEIDALEDARQSCPADALGNDG